MKLLDESLKNVKITNDVGEACFHVFDKDMINAVNAALVINRPLLIWGEPGIGKSQLARAVAKELGRAFLHFVADARTESRDLLYHFDAVARLAEAQLHSHGQYRDPPKTKPNDEDKTDNCKDNSQCLCPKDPMAMENFIVPGRLWWALNWESARQQARLCCREEPQQLEPECDPQNGTVLLIDEIDKADTDVPNGLLEALGASQFHPQGLDQPVQCQSANKPLVMITTNEERVLPDAFLRRCLSLHLSFPEDEKAQKEFLIQRALANFSLDKMVIGEAAAMLVEDRTEAKNNNRYPLPGQAEFFDLLRGIARLSQEQNREPGDYIAMLRKFTYQKHPDFHRKEGKK